MPKMWGVTEEYLNSTAISSYLNESNSINASETNGEQEIARIFHVTGRPILVLFGTVGNLLAFYVMQRSSLNKVSTCFYMSILALADTGKNLFLMNDIFLS